MIPGDQGGDGIGQEKGVGRVDGGVPAADGGGVVCGQVEQAVGFGAGHGAGKGSRGVSSFRVQVYLAAAHLS